MKYWQFLLIFSISPETARVRLLLFYFNHLHKFSNCQNFDVFIISKCQQIFISADDVLALAVNRT